ncbi:hypothetical protein GVM20_09210 [Porphyrobacter sp. SLTP]|uniref:hypothetical protein n=1 Tax=Porphyrobacter sp. SLTP TaxID=2683266 RepID=UPI001411B57B|nr:hypothetical protein [Porphyrobacter sp. SLTP]NBB25301.1 hypothetical protein [Porphyrobacter sp. SLTP]
MAHTQTAQAIIKLALLATVTSAGYASAEEPLPMTSDDQACERVMSVLVANRTFHADQLAGCDGGRDDQNPGFYVLRVNGICGDPQGCGTVLMGWYAVEASTGAVHKWDVAEWQLGARIDGQD